MSFAERWSRCTRDQSCPVVARVGSTGESTLVRLARCDEFRCTLHQLWCQDVEEGGHDQEAIDTSDVDLCVVSDEEGSVFLLQRHEEVVDAFAVDLAPACGTACDGESADGGVCGEKMRVLAWSTPKAAIWVLPCQDLVDDAAGPLAPA